MKVVFLGTGTSAGIPMVACDCSVCASKNIKDKRLRSSIMISVNNKNIVIDSGPDFRQQMLNNKINRLDALLLTHEHKDHTAGLDDIRAFNFKENKEIDVYASLRVQTAIRKQFSYIFENSKYPGVPKIRFQTFSGEEFWVSGIKVIPIEVMHYKLPVWGFRVENFTYITDANFISDEEKEKIRGSKIIVLNALRKEKHISHFTLSQAISLINELRPEKAFFTHISHQLGLHNKIEQELPENTHLAYDGLELNC